jgi:hypothetical protein
MAGSDIVAVVPGWSPDQVAENMAELILSRLGDDRKTTRWSAGLALVCFAPSMPDHLSREVHRRLTSILAT